MEPLGEPHQAIFLILPYLPLHQLLSMSQVCKSLRDAIAEDTLAWRDVIVEPPLSMRVTDDVLMKITAKAHRRLRTLALINCGRISDDGLLAVVDCNPSLSKLYIPGCIGLTPGGVIEAVKKLSKHNSNTLTSIKVNGIYNLNQHHLQTLHSMLPKAGPVRTLRFYHRYNTCYLDDHHRPIDVETCGKCKQVKLVFDCPRETCIKKLAKGGVECRGCVYCVPRCEGCGRCVLDEGDQQAETVCNDTLCLECWLLVPKCDHCNRPFCPRHGGLDQSEGSAGFVCDGCNEKKDPYYDL